MDGPALLSIQMTSAPWSAIMEPTSGPATEVAEQSTRMPLSVPNLAYYSCPFCLLSAVAAGDHIYCLSISRLVVCIMIWSVPPPMR